MEVEGGSGGEGPPTRSTAGRLVDYAFLVFYRGPCGQVCWGSPVNLFLEATQAYGSGKTENELIGASSRSDDDKPSGSAQEILGAACPAEVRAETVAKKSSGGCCLCAKRKQARPTHPPANSWHFF